VNLLVTVAAALLSMPAPPADAPRGLDDLAWMSGCWMQTRPDGFVEEHWMKPAGGALLGMSRTVKGNRTTEWEFLRIADEGGRLAYVARPSGQAENVFPLKTLSRPRSCSRIRSTTSRSGSSIGATRTARSPREWRARWAGR
jgi:hypothetical protein